MRMFAVDSPPPSARQRCTHGPLAERIPAAVLLADISGFTALTERLAREGTRGAEEIQRVLNLCLGRQIDLIHAHAGEVWRFAGDGAPRRRGREVMMTN